METNECEEGHSGRGHDEHERDSEHREHHHHHEREYCFEFDTKPYETEHHEVTPERIRKIVDLPAGTVIVEILEDGTQKTLQEGEEVHLHHCSKFRKLPRFTRGRTRMATDLGLVKKEYPALFIGPNDEYFLIPGFPLPDLFTQSSADLLVVIPPTYPPLP